MPTLRELIDGTLERLSLASGVDTQVYSEVPITRMIQHKFDVLFDKYWWPQFTHVGTYTLDGTTGIITGDISTDIKRWKDLRFVYPGTSDISLPRMPTRGNPANVKRKSIGPYNDPTKLFRVWPLNTTGDVTVVGRTYPDKFENDDDIVDLDEHLIILGTAYDYLNGIGTNPAEEEKLLAMFNARLIQEVGTIDHFEESTDAATENVVNSWQELN